MPEINPEIALKVRNIYKSFSSTEVLRGVNCDIKAGTVFGIIGPNGAGKTTLLRILATTLSPDSGDFTMKGFLYPEELAKIRELIGFSPDPLPIDWRVKAYDFLLFTARIYDKPLSRIEEVLELTGLKDEAFKMVKAYSKGMLKRLAFARVLLMDPEVFILDEPTSGLDPSGQIKIQDAILTMERKDKVMLLSSNNLHEVERMCDDVLFLKDGVLTTVDSVSETFEEEQLYIIEMTLRKVDELLLNKTLARFFGLRVLSKKKNKVRFASVKEIKKDELVDFMKDNGGEIEDIKIL